VPAARDQATTLGELAAVFLKLGTISFGGPAAHIALMRVELVERRRWLSDQAFLDLVGATNLIPGPNSTEMAIHIGYLRCGWPGLIVAGTCFILPAALIVGALAAVYVRSGSLPAVQAVFYGIKAVVVAIVAVALWGLARTAVRSVWLALLGSAAVVALLFGVHELAVLGAAGVIAGVARAGRRPTGPSAAAAIPVSPMGFALPAATVTAAAAFTPWQLFLVFGKAGAFLFGSGYVLLAFLRADLVERLRWLTEQQLLDAISVGQFTPGPVFTTATFIGYLLDGPRGAVVATVAIFLPAFVYVALSGPLVPRLRASPIAGGVLDGVNVASLAMMAVVTWHLGRAAVIDPVSAALAGGSLGLLLLRTVNPAWLILVGALVGAVVRGL
jgi:chromate transporter